MIGVFDSGRGGLAAFFEIRKALPLQDIAYLADRENAPYGTKSPERLIRLVENDIRRLSEIGAKRILIACCTASTVYGELAEKYRSISIPIVEPTAMAVAEATSGHVTVFATEATVRSEAFSKALGRYSSAEVYEIAAQGLVTLIEEQAPGGDVFKKVGELIGKMPKNTDTVVLGCTHFSFAKRIFAELLGPQIRVVDAAAVGAKSIICESENVGCGKVLYT